MKTENNAAEFDLDEVYRFHTISEFLTSVTYGAEVVFEWKGQEYGIWPEKDVVRITRTAEPDKDYVYSSPNEALEFMVGGDRLRDVITQVTVIDRTI